MSFPNDDTRPVCRDDLRRRGIGGSADSKRRRSASATWSESAQTRNTRAYRWTAGRRCEHTERRLPTGTGVPASPSAYRRRPSRRAATVGTRAVRAYGGDGQTPYTEDLRLVDVPGAWWREAFGSSRRRDERRRVGVAGTLCQTRLSPRSYPPSRPTRRSGARRTSACSSWSRSSAWSFRSWPGAFSRRSSRSSRSCSCASRMASAISTVRRNGGRCRSWPSAR